MYRKDSVSHFDLAMDSKPLDRKLLSRKDRAYCRYYYNRLRTRRRFSRCQALSKLATHYDCSLQTITRVIWNQYMKKDNCDSDEKYLNEDDGNEGDGDTCTKKSITARSSGTVALNQTPSRGKPTLRSSTRMSNSTVQRPISQQTASVASSPSPPASCSLGKRTAACHGSVSPASQGGFREFLGRLGLAHLTEAFADRGFCSWEDLQTVRHLPRKTREYTLKLLLDTSVIDVKELSVLHGALTDE